MTELTAPALPEPSGPLDDVGAGASARHGIARYVARRLAQAIVLLFIVVTAVFGLSHLAANPVDILLPPGATPHQRAVETRLLGLNRSLVAQRSLVTLRLAIAAIVLAIVVGVPVGVLMAVRAGTWIDRAGTLIVGLAQGVASFWLAVILVFLIGVDLALVPVSGDQGFSSLILPAASLALAPMVSFVRLTRAAMIDALATDYVTAARARGVRPREIVIRHALRNSIIPVLTYGGMLLGQLISGAVITEQIFAWPGIGQLSILSIQNGDYGVVEAITMITAAAVIALNLLVDLSYLVLDPRVRDALSSGGRG